MNINLEVGKFNWRILRTLSSCAFVVMVVIQGLDWYNSDHFESLMNEPAAKAYWLQIKHLYETIGWISIAVMIGLRVCYWTIEYLHDRRQMMSNRGDGWQNKQVT